MKTATPPPATIATPVTTERWDYFIAGHGGTIDGLGIYWFKAEADMRDWFNRTPNPPPYASVMYRLNRNRTKPSEPAAFLVKAKP